MLRKLLRRNLKITPHMALVSAEKDKLTFVTVFTEKKSTIPDSDFDTLVCAGSMKSVDDLYWTFKEEGRLEVHRLGDAKAPSCVEIAIRDAELLARAL
jgi:hypothetical protein